MNNLLKDIEMSKYPFWRLNLAKPELSVVTKHGTKQVEGDFIDFAKSIVKEITDKKKSDPTIGRSFEIKVSSLNYRIQLMGLNGNLAAARLIQSKNPVLEKLGIKEDVIDILGSRQLSEGGGLVLFSGEIGSGKTTTAMATICRQLENHGGFCLSIEDPIEFPNMSGFHGNKGGFMDQIGAKNLDYATPLIESLRCFPPGERGLLYIGEIRDSRTAAEALRFSIAGHLVMTTIHSNNAISALQRILSLASKAGEEQARSLLANSLKLVINQKLVGDILKVQLLKGNIDPKNTVCPRIAQGHDLTILKDLIKDATAGVKF